MIQVRTKRGKGFIIEDKEDFTELYQYLKSKEKHNKGILFLDREENLLFGKHKVPVKKGNVIEHRYKEDSFYLVSSKKHLTVN